MNISPEYFTLLQNEELHGISITASISTSTRKVGPIPQTSLLIPANEAIVQVKEIDLHKDIMLYDRFGSENLTNEHRRAYWGILQHTMMPYRAVSNNFTQHVLT